jgi:hypothetical protein
LFEFPLNSVSIADGGTLNMFLLEDFKKKFLQQDIHLAENCRISYYNYAEHKNTEIWEIEDNKNIYTIEKDQESFKVYTQNINSEIGLARGMLPDSFEIEYFLPIKSDSPFQHKKWALNRNNLNNLQVLITKEKNQPPRFKLKKFGEQHEGDDYTSDPEDTKDPKKFSTKDLLPSKIIGYSSGMNEIISLPFFKMRYHYFHQIQSNIENELFSEIGDSRMVFMD